MSKIRVLHKAPVLNDLGVILSVVELAGPSSESKPTTGIANGSLFLETDTGKIFIFDEDDGWSETGSGGGGGGSSDNILVVELSYIDDDDPYYELEANYNDINTALAAGKPVFAIGDEIQITCLSVYADVGLDRYKAHFVAPVYNGVAKWTFEAIGSNSNLQYYPT